MYTCYVHSDNGSALPWLYKISSVLKVTVASLLNKQNHCACVSRACEILK